MISRRTAAPVTKPRPFQPTQAVPCFFDHADVALPCGACLLLFFAGDGWMGGMMDQASNLSTPESLQAAKGAVLDKIEGAAQYVLL